MTAQPQVWRKKPVNVEVMQFLDWGTAGDIMAWAPGVYYVPGGFEHGLRSENEHDRSRGDVLDTAPSFLAVPDIMTMSNGREVPGYARADIGDYIIRTADNRLLVARREQFQDTHERVHDL